LKQGTYLIWLKTSR